MLEAAKTAKVKKAGRLGAEQRRTGYLFILPNCIIFMLFFVVPAVLGFYYSLTEFNGFGSPKFIGFANYAKLFADQDFYKILGHTFLYVLLTVPTVYVAALAVAIGLTRIWIRGRDIMRVSIFWPTMISTIIVGLIWRWIFGENSGIVNYLLTLLNGSGLPWLTNNALAMVTLVIATIWSKAGYFMIIFVGGIEAIPESYYEAAHLDGATPWQVFRRITFPLLRPTSFMVLMLCMINSFKEYPMILSLTGGGPADSTTLVIQYIYKTGFDRSNVGYASAASMVMFVILVIIAVVQFKLNKGGSND